MFGQTAAAVMFCRSCHHGSLAEAPDARAMSGAYAEAADPVSLREEAGQVETARRSFARIEEILEPGLVCDVGCWTGSLLLAARERSWQTMGVEPSVWASREARRRNLQVTTAELFEARIEAGSCRLITLCDVLEHVSDPGPVLDRLLTALEPGGGIYLTVPDAGSRLARIMGRRWWSVLPMHVQYFTRSSMRRLLEEHGLQVRFVDSHAKAFSARYYGERLAGYSTVVGRAAVAAVEAVGWQDRLVAPDFRDRMAVLATRSVSVP